MWLHSEPSAPSQGGKPRVPCASGCVASRGGCPFCAQGTAALAKAGSRSASRPGKGAARPWSTVWAPMLARWGGRPPHTVPLRCLWWCRVQWAPDAKPRGPVSTLWDVLPAPVLGPGDTLSAMRSCVIV